MNEALRPTIMEIDCDALRHNLSLLKKHSGSSRMMAVIKANAYGHGLIECAKVVQAHGADYIGVALVEEGVHLRQAGITLPILIFGGMFSDQVGVYLDHNLEITASSVDKLKVINDAARARNVRARIHIKIDTGMGRIGVRPSSAAAVFEAATSASHCDLVGVFTHFATADEPDISFARTQLERFQECLTWFPKHKKPMPLRHAANSAALMQLPESHLDMVRPGIALFGVPPSHHLRDALPIKPVMKVTSRVVYFKVLLAGESVSYGRTWKATKNSRIVTIPVGYGDGYPRALSNKGSVLIRNKRYPIVGRVCMDQVMVNIGVDEAYNGDEVVLIGTQGKETITVDEIAELSGTISYDILTALNLRIPRRFHSI